MRQGVKEALRNLKVYKALRIDQSYPETLPTPDSIGSALDDGMQVKGLNSVALFLGPYRNLTTLSASILFLHPEVQVLNHAGERVLTDTELNFLEDYSEDKFNAFCQRAIQLSMGGARGQYGGSIVLSHAFAEHPKMQESYFGRFGSRLLKSPIRSLVWKESQRVTRILREDENRLDQIFEQNNKVRFLLPIRNPIDCANSIRRVGLKRIYGLDENTDLRQVIDLVLDDLHWFIEKQKLYPDRFFHFFQHEVGAKVLGELADYLGISRDARWIDDTLDIYRLREAYGYEDKVMKHYVKGIRSLFGKQEEIASQFMRLAGAA